jgi:hypothetical protein
LGEDLSLDALMRFYRLPRFTLAPDESMIRLLRDRTRVLPGRTRSAWCCSRLVLATRTCPGEPAQRLNGRIGLFSWTLN